MSSQIPLLYSHYTTAVSKFEEFHNQVINMPRDEFSSATFQKIRSLASYLLLIENFFDYSKGHNYKEIMGLVINELSKGNFPSENNRNLDLESRYFRSDVSLDILYAKEGRMFRHLMGLLAFFNIIYSYLKQKKYIKFDICL